MGQRERKREELRKRKRRSAETVISERDAGETESFQERMSKRSEQRNAEARAQLEPLADGERPTAVTVSAVVASVAAVIFTVSAALAAAGVELQNGSTPRAAPIVLFGVVLWMMVWGLWKARYWAVLGFQVVLLLVLLASALALVQIQTVFQAIGTVLLLAGSGALFYFMIRAMARIQMPERPGT